MKIIAALASFTLAAVMWKAAQIRKSSFDMWLSGWLTAIGVAMLTLPSPD